MKQKEQKREIWLDSARIIACILVAFGHGLTGLVDSGAMQGSSAYSWYMLIRFNVPVFFFCSGYLYNKGGGYTDIKSYGLNIAKKALELGVPYFVFQTAHLIIKVIFKDIVNEEAPPILYSLFVAPASQYWYLYTLFFMFVFTPPVRSKRGMVTLLFVAVVCNVMCYMLKLDEKLPFAISVTARYLLLFSIGMATSFFGWQEKFSWKLFGVGLLFFPISIFYYMSDFRSGQVTSLICMLGMLMLVIFMYCAFRNRAQLKLFTILKKYTMPIYLLHTIFAAGIRNVLLKAGVTNVAVYILWMLVGSVLGPMLVGWVAKKTKYLEFFFYPTKFIKIKAAKSDG